MVTSIGDFVSVFFDLCSYLITYRVIFGAKYKKNAFFSLFILVSVCIGLVCLSVFTGNAVNPGKCSLLAGVIIPFLFKGNTFKWIGLYFPVFGLPTTIETLTGIAVSSFDEFATDTVFNSYLKMFLGYFVFSGFCYLIYSLKRSKRGLDLNVMQIALLNICTFLVGVALGKRGVLVDGADRNAIESYFIFVIVMVIIIYLLVVYSIYLDKLRMHESFVAECRKNTLRSQKEQIEAILESEKKLRKCRHDFKTHIYALSSLADAGDTDGLKNYCEELVDDAKSYSKAIISGNVAVDGILGRCIDKCKDMGINFDYQIKLLNENKADDYELCIIFSNIMNNAIEACRSGDEIRLVCYPYNDLLCILQRNPLHNELKYEDGKLVTTKDDKEMHGHGIDNVRTIVDKYEGRMNIKEQNGNFEVEILI